MKTFQRIKRFIDKHILHRDIFDVSKVEIDWAKGTGHPPVIEPGPKGVPRVRATYVPKPGQKATRQDMGKFMKHGRQAPWYRKSVKAKKRPEEEDA